MEIRKAHPSDWSRIRELISLYPDTLVQDDLPRPEEFFVAIEDGGIVGCAALEVYNKRLAEVRSLAVEKNKQNNGAGGALIDACMKEAERQGIKQVLTITGRPEMFERQGFSSFKSEKLALIRNMPSRKKEE